MSFGKLWWDGRWKTKSQITFAENITLETSKHGDLEISSCLISTPKKETPAGNFVFFLSKEKVWGRFLVSSRGVRSNISHFSMTWERMSVPRKGVPRVSHQNETTTNWLVLTTPTLLRPFARHFGLGKLPFFLFICSSLSTTQLTNQRSFQGQTSNRPSGNEALSGKSLRDCHSSKWMFPKIGVPKMDGENNGKPY